MSTALVLVVPQIWATAESRPVEAGFGPAAVRMRALVRKEEPVSTTTGVKRHGRLQLVREQQVTPEPAAAANPELAFYRKYTEAMLRRYMKLSMEGGRAPSLLGRELFRGKVSDYKVRSFDDVVIFVHDVEKCLDKLGMGQQALVRRIALQEYTQEEAAVLLRLRPTTAVRRYSEALDELTEMFLERKMLERQQSCQGG